MAAMIVGALLVVAGLCLAVPALVLSLQCAAALRRTEHVDEPWAGEPVGPIAVIVPAHNEAQGMAPTLQAIRDQLRAHDRLVVVADNCDDGTAKVAAEYTAEVIERHDHLRRGKGYALEAGVEHLRGHPPEVGIVVDADCMPGPDLLQRIAALTVRTGRPVQCLYLMDVPPDASSRLALAGFAWRVRNHARPLGGLRLGWPCQLMGTGMAFPWELLGRVSLGSSNIVEDMQLGIDLALTGSAPLFCPLAQVRSRFPESAEGWAAQRMRWEHGHLAVLLRQAMPLLWHGIRRREWSAIAMALDLCVPPLAALVLACAGLAGISVAFGAMTDCWLPLGIVAVALLIVASALSTVWWRFGRQALPARQLKGIPMYILGKLPMYARFLIGRQTRWVRTKRDGRTG